MIQKIIAFILSFFAFLTSLFGGGSETVSPKTQQFLDVSYGSEQRNTMDMYLPENASGEMGILLMIHGGGWIAGDKSDYNNAAESFCKDKCIATVTMNYRYIDKNTNINDIMDDITAALNKATEIASSQGVTLTKLMTTGHSAGGHLSLLYAYSRANESPVEPVCVADYAGVTDLTDEGFYTSVNAVEFYEVMGYACGKQFTEETFETAKSALLSVSPISYATTAVPTIINHGEKDEMVPYSNALSLIQALDAAGVHYDFISYPNSGHALTQDKDCENASYAKFLEYINTYLK